MLHVMDALRFTMCGLDAFVAVTAIWGGVWLAIGLEAERFPLDMLQRTPFRSYLVPGLILAIAVGGSSAAATVAVLVLTEAAGGGTSVIAGTVLIGWIIGERLLLRAPSLLEAGYFAVALAIAGLGIETLLAGMSGA